MDKRLFTQLIIFVAIHLGCAHSPPKTLFASPPQPSSHSTQTKPKETSTSASTKRGSERKIRISSSLQTCLKLGQTQLGGDPGILLTGPVLDLGRSYWIDQYFHIEQLPRPPTMHTAHDAWSAASDQLQIHRIVGELRGTSLNSTSRKFLNYGIRHINTLAGRKLLEWNPSFEYSRAFALTIRAPADAPLIQLFREDDLISSDALQLPWKELFRAPAGLIPIPLIPAPLRWITGTPSGTVQFEPFAVELATESAQTFCIPTSHAELIPNAP